MATPTQTVVWTALPAGFVKPADAKQLRLTVAVSPRLVPTTEQRLGVFADFVNWPATVRKMRFTVKVQGGPTLELKPTTQTSDPLDEALWARLFDTNTFVRGHAFTELKNEKLRTFPAADLYEYIREFYEETALQHPTDFPKLQAEPLSGWIRDLAPLRLPQQRGKTPAQLIAERERRVDELYNKNKVISPFASAASLGFTSDRQWSFYQATRFYHRPENKNKYSEAPKPELVPARPKEPEIDFHQCVAALSDYPRLLRRLGLVIELDLPAEGMPASSRLQVIPQWGDPHVGAKAERVPSTPGWTNYELSKTLFFTRPKAAESEWQQGYLDLRTASDQLTGKKDKPAPFVVAQVDVDGAALKTVDFAANLVQMSAPAVANYDTPTDAAAPTLRSAGLALLRRGRAWETYGRFERASSLQAGLAAKTAANLFAEDVLRGYRLDVWDSVSKQWHPVCAREGTYVFNRKGEAVTVSLDDEGYVKSASVSRAEPGAPERDLYLHERVVEFEGWSLVATRPGKALPRDPTNVQPVEPETPAAADYGLGTRFRVPKGSLPRLRFGRSYRLRVRWVDLAGNSVVFDQNDQFASPALTFTRFEPIASPTLVPRARYTEGESLEHLVIRSDVDLSTAEYAAAPAVQTALDQVRARLTIAAGDKPDHVYRPHCDRHVVPPKAAQLFAEQHGCFDAYIGPGKDHAAGHALARREAGNLFARRWVRLSDGVEEPIPGADVRIASVNTAPTSLAGLATGDPLQPGEYVLHRETQLLVPYLPDPLAIGVVFVGLPGVPPGKPLHVLYDKPWPEPVPFRLRVVEGPGVFDSNAQTFVGCTAPVWTNTSANAEEARVLTVFLPKGTTAKVRYSSVFAKEALELFGLWEWLRPRGAARNAIKASAIAGRHWMLTPFRTLTLVHASQHPLRAPELYKFSAGKSLGATAAILRGLSKLSVSSTALLELLADWREPVDDLAQPAPQWFDRHAQVVDLPIEPVFRDDHPIPATEAGAPPKAKEAPRHEFGDTKHRRVFYRLKATTRFREYFPTEITRAVPAITTTGPEYELHVPSSARPAAPAPVYVVPTFRWSETKTREGVTRTRWGGGLRVYLERPWWSSGEDELLGVVLRQGAVDDTYKPFVTQWGLDPLFSSPLPSKQVQATSFPLRQFKEYDTMPLSLAERGDADTSFRVAGHGVEYDPVRKLWFSDIEVRPGSYFPFIRLALTRYQPWSIAHCHLSRVVMTDFIQVVPDRTVEVRWIGPRTARVKIYGVAPDETLVSKLIMYVRSGSASPALAREFKDIPSTHLVAEKMTSTLQATTIKELSPVERVRLEELLKVKTEPAAPSKKLGLNEYTVTVETLPDDASPDFGWKPLDGVTVTKPFVSPVTKAKAATKTTVASTTTTSKTAKRVTAAKTAKVTTTPAVGSVQATTGVKAVEIDDLTVQLTRTPLWEGDVTFPEPALTAPHRLVVQEHELFLRATSTPADATWFARRLVYADIVPFGPRRPA